MLGGYQVIDFKGTNLGSDAVIIKDAFKKAKSGKALLIENMTGVSGFVYDVAVNSTDTAVIPLMLVIEDAPVIGIITITDEDACTLSVGD